MTAVYTYCTVVLGVALIIALLRMERGPSMLDRVVALDVVTAAVLGSIAVITARTYRTDLVPVLVVLSIVGFVGSVVIARFVAVERAEDARILTQEEVRQVLAQQNAIDDEAEPVHDPDAARAREAGIDPAGSDGPVLGLEVEPEAPPRDGEMGEGARGADR